MVEASGTRRGDLA